MTSIGVPETPIAPFAAQESRKGDSVLRPHSFLFHPYRGWLDKLLSWILSLAIPFKVTTKYPATPTPETMAMRTKLQKRCTSLIKLRMKPAINKWSALYGGAPIVESILKVPRHCNILVEWGILTKDEMPQTELEQDGFVNVFVRFPISLLPETKRSYLLTKNKRSADSGCLQIESFDLNDIPADVPVVIWFHGGGMTFGTYDDPDGVEAVSGIVEKATQFGNSSSGVHHPTAIVASVQYRLAPQHPFPAAPIDGLSVTRCFLESHPSRKIHLGGVSAGGYMGIIATLETYRQYPGRVGSLYAISPMFGPATDSESYYLESTASLNCPVGFLRWCWQSYLELDKDADSSPVNAASSYGNELQRLSTRKAWEQCKWIKTGGRRLIEPSVDLPLDLAKEEGPKIFIVTNMADPLHDDGVQIAYDLKNAGSFVKHVDCLGGHVIGYELDSSSKERTIIAWSEVAFKAK